MTHAIMNKARCGHEVKRGARKASCRTESKFNFNYPTGGMLQAEGTNEICYSVSDPSSALKHAAWPLHVPFSPAVAKWQFRQLYAPMQYAYAYAAFSIRHTGPWASGLSFVLDS